MNRAFTTILAAETISEVGSRITAVALPLAAVVVLRATPLQIGLLSAAGALSFVLAGLVGGVFVDNAPKRAVIVAANAVNCIVLALVPLSYLAGLLSLPLLLVVGLLSSGIASTGGLALMSAIPSYVPGPRLAEANGRFSALRSFAGVLGPAIAGVLIGAVGAANSVAFDAASFACAGLLWLTFPAAAPRSVEGRSGAFVTRLREGFRFTFQHQTLRQMTILAALTNLAVGAFMTLEPLYLVRTFGLPASWFGVAVAGQGLGAVLGAMASARMAGRWGVLTLFAAAIVGLAFGKLGLLALGGSPEAIAVGYAALQTVTGFALALFGVAFMTFIQTETPPGLLARVMGVLISMSGASTPLGAIAAGALADTAGIRHGVEATVAFTFAIVLGLPWLRRPSA